MKAVAFAALVLLMLQPVPAAPITPPPATAPARVDNLSKPYSQGARRRLARDLLDRASRRAQSADSEGFLRDILLARHLLSHAAQERSLLDLHFAVTFTITADNAIADAAARSLLSGEQCAQLRQALVALPPLPTLRETLPFEREQFLTSLRSLSQGEPQPNIPFLAGVQIAEVDWPVATRRAEKLFDDIDRVLSLPKAADRESRLTVLQNAFSPDSQWLNDPNLDPEPFNHTPEERKQITERALAQAKLRAAKQPAETRDAYTRRIFGTFAPLSMPSFGSFPEHRRQESLARSDMLLLFLAAAELKAKTGAWPVTPADLAPLGITKLPPDPYSPTHEPLRFHILQGIPHISSVGPKQKENSFLLPPSP